MAQKTFEEILSESTELKLTDKFKNKIFEFSNDVHAMGIVINTREEGNSKFFFKDQEYTKPITDNEFLAMYLDEVVPTRLVDNNKSLERIRDLKSEKLKFLEYKSDDITKKFYKIGNYFSGETYNSFHDGSEDEKPAMQTIWEGTFTGTERTEGGDTYFEYLPIDMQNAGILIDIDEVTVTFDGVQYTLQVETYVAEGGGGAHVGTTNPFEDCFFSFNYEYDNEEEFIGIVTRTAGPHTLKVEYTPVEQRTIWSGTFTPTEQTWEGYTSYFYETQDIQNAELLADIPAVSIVYDGAEYETPVSYYNDDEFAFGQIGANVEIIPFSFSYFNDNEGRIEIGCLSGGEHTLEVKELGGRTIVPQFSGTVTESTDTETATIIPIYHNYNANLFSRLPDTLDITINGTLYENVPSYVAFEGEVNYGGNPSDWHGSNYPFAIIFNLNSSELQVFAEHGGEYTIKIEGDLKEDGGSTLRVLYDGEITGGTVQGDFVYLDETLSDLFDLKKYTQATITVNNESKTTLPVNEVQGDYGKNYILGMDAYPPTELSRYGVGIAYVYEGSGKTVTRVLYIITEDLQQPNVHSLKVEVDENDKIETEG